MHGRQRNDAVSAYDLGRKEVVPFYQFPDIMAKIIEQLSGILSKCCLVPAHNPFYYTTFCVLCEVDKNNKRYMVRK